MNLNQNNVLVTEPVKQLLLVRRARGDRSGCKGTYKMVGLDKSLKGEGPVDLRQGQCQL